MKITRHQLRKLILEVLDEGSYKYMVTPDGETYTMDQLSRIKKTGRTLDALSTGKHPKLGKLKQFDPDHARVLATDADYQPELTQIEIGAQSIPDSDFNKPDTPLQHFSLNNSLMIINHLRRECQERGYNCTINDERQFDPDDPFIAFHIDGGDGAMDFSVHLSDLSGIDIYDNLERGVFEPYDYHSVYPSTENSNDFEGLALQILDIVEEAANFDPLENFTED